MLAGGSELRAVDLRQVHLFYPPRQKFNFIFGVQNVGCYRSNGYDQTCLFATRFYRYYLR